MLNINPVIYTIDQFKKAHGVSQNEIGRLTGQHQGNMSSFRKRGKHVIKNQLGEIRLIDKELAEFLSRGSES